MARISDSRVHVFAVKSDVWEKEAASHQELTTLQRKLSI